MTKLLKTGRQSASRSQDQADIARISSWLEQAQEPDPEIEAFFAEFDRTMEIARKNLQRARDLLP